MSSRLQSLQWKVLPGAAFVMLGAAWVSTSCTQQEAKIAQSSLLADGGSSAPGELSDGGPTSCTLPVRDPVVMQATRLIEEGRRTFRFDTFGDEAFWGDSLQLHVAIAGEKNGGTGLGLSPRTALEVLGLKIDADALPPTLLVQLQQGQLDLNDPTTTLELLELNAVVGMTGFFREDRSLRSVGIQCALCHSTVDDSVTQGVGKRRDGWANRDLDLGALIALAPDVSKLTEVLGLTEETVRTVLNSWGPGKLNAELLLDGKAFRPDGQPAGTMIRSSFGLAGISRQTSTGWRSASHCNVLMNGKGTFADARLNDADRFPVAARAGAADVQNTPDLVTPKLAALHFYQLALRAPQAPEGSFDQAGAARGKTLFEAKAHCSNCHVPPLFTEPGWNMHTAQELGIDDFQARRSPDERYRTAPLAGLFTHTKGGFYHDGRFAKLADVIAHYDKRFRLDLTAQEQLDLAEYLKSL